MVCRVEIVWNLVERVADGVKAANHPADCRQLRSVQEVARDRVCLAPD